MRTNKKFNFFFIFLSIVNCSTLMSQNISNPISGHKGWTVKEPFKAEVFIENKGQFDKPDGRPLENILYGINSGEFHVYFTPNSLSYHVIDIELLDKSEEAQEEILEEAEKQFYKKGKIDHAYFKKFYSDKSAYVNVEWIDANPDAQLVVSESVPDYYTYSKEENGTLIPIKAYAFKKLTYKNLYPHIDVEYYFPDASTKSTEESYTTTGLKYNVVVYPGGDVSKVKMKYNGHQTLSLDEKGNVVIAIPCGNITDHAPLISYDERGNHINTQFVIHDKTVSFQTSAYDKNQKLVIDPFVSVWNTNPAFVGSNAGYNIRVDYNKNAYVLGGGVLVGGAGPPNRTYQVKKFNPAGVLQWTYTSASIFNGWAGDITVTRTGTSYIGFGLGSGNTVYKLSNAGTLISSQAAQNEPWRLSYNLAVNNGILYIGGGSLNGTHLYRTDTNLTATTQYGPWNSTDNNEDVAYLAQDNSGSFVYSTIGTKAGVTNSPTAPYLVKVSAATLGTAVWRSKDFSPLQELGQMSFANNGAAPGGGFTRGWSTGLNGMVVCNDRVYTYDGKVVRGWNTANGAVMDTVLSGGGFDKFSGIGVDNCCRVYIGLNSIIKRYSPTLTYDISIPVTSDVYDLIFDPLDDNRLYVTGKGFVQMLENSSCPTCINSTSTNVSGCTLGTATATVNDPGATAPFTYSWNTVPAQTTQTATGLTAGTYIVTVTDGASPCPLTWKDTVVITGTFVSCGPTVTTTNNSVCSGNCNTITATGSGGTSPYTYSWNPGAGTGSSFSVCPASTTTYTVVTTDGTGATASNTAVVTVNSAPTVNIAGTTTLCSGQSTTLTASGGGTYMWNTGATTTSITVSPVSASTYTVTATTNGCTGSVSVAVAVNANPSPTISGTTTICAGTSTTLTATGGGTYAWSTGDLTAATTVTPSGTSTYTVTVTNAGCTGSTSVVVTVAANLIPAITGNTTVCTGSSTTLSTSGGGTYSWSDGSTSSSITVSPVGNTSYSVTVVNGSCSGTASVSVSVVSNPTPTVTGTTSVCPGTSTVLTANGGGTYLWNTGATSTSITVSPVSVTTYTVTANTSGCTGQTTVVVTISPPPSPTITGTTNICNGGSTTLTANAGGTYLWNTGATSNSISVSPTGNTNYTVTVTTNGCSGVATAMVTVNATPAPIITGTTSICNGQSTTLTSSTVGPYSWNTGATTNSITVSPSSSSSYIVSVTVNGCTGTSSITVTVVPPVVASITGNDICIGDDVVLTAGGGTSYLWNTGATSASITETPTVNTTYTVIVSVGACADTASYVVTVNPLPIPIASGDTTINYGNSTPLSSSGGGTYSWTPPADLSCANCANPIATPSATTQYCVTVTTGGCADSACVTVIVDLKCGFEGELFVPNGFSPNNDGQNDVLFVRGLGITEMFWAIYDRWGEKVFESTDPKLGWDGTYKGKQLDPAVFVYYLEVICITGDEIKQKGNVAIIK